jgi:hypothetical protein
LVTDRSSNAAGVLGDVEVEVEGIVYRIHQLGANQREVIRRSDNRRVGTLRGSPSSMWLLEPEEIDDALLRTIVRTAIEEGLFGDLPTD